MSSRLSTTNLARVSARRPWVVVLAWLVLLIVSGIGAGLGLGDVVTTDVEFLARPESVRADELLRERFYRPRFEAGGATGPSQIVVIQSEAATVDEATFRAKVEGVAAALRAETELVAAAPTYYEAAAAGMDIAAEMVSADRRTTLIPVDLVVGFDWDEETGSFEELVAAQGGDGFTVVTVGEPSVDKLFNETSESDLQKEILGLPVTLVVLVVVFGALVAAGVPILLSLFAIGVAMGLTAAIGQVWQLSLYVINMITVIGLAVGIDYALFVVERYREERRAGLGKHEAIARAGGTASKAVLFSGVTVVLALTGMFLIPTTIFRSLGLGAILVTIVAVAATLTLVPALLSLLGDRLDWPRGAFGAEGSGRRTDEGPLTPDPSRRGSGEMSAAGGGVWGRVTRGVMKRPVLGVGLAAGALLLMSLPALDLRTGTAGASTLPEGDVRTAFRILEEEFAAGVLSPVEIVVDGARTPEVESGIDRLLSALAADPAYGPVLGREWNAAGDLALVEVPLRGDPNAPAAMEAVERLREEQAPAAFEGVDAATVLVTGDPAENLDFTTLVEEWTPVVFAFVLGLSFLLLLLAFRSIVVPLKAIVMNLLSVGAAYGLTVLVFQKRVGADLLGFQETPTIEAWVPIFLFCVLFGLSMDYHVFLLSRIREHFDATGDNRASVAVGLRSTARIITGAALIMVVVFGAFAAGDLVMFQQMGFGLSVAILLDATVVRSVLVPASMVLLGDRNWYLPRWLRWLPDLRVEGGPAQSVRLAGRD